METILGLAIIYVWVHSIFVVVRKVEGTTTYEKGVMTAGVVGFLLYIFGTI